MTSSAKAVSTLAGVFVLAAALLFFSHRTPSPVATADRNAPGETVTGPFVSLRSGDGAKAGTTIEIPPVSRPRADDEATVGPVRGVVEFAIPLLADAWVWALVAALVIGFLVIQDRIDRHDPRLADAPVQNRPALVFEAPNQGRTNA